MHLILVIITRYKFFKFDCFFFVVVVTFFLFDFFLLAE